jgi:plastocyanin
MMRTGSRSFALVVAAVTAALSAGGLRTAAAEGRPTPAPTWADLHKLEQELRDQRQLILQLMQNEQQRYDLLLKMIPPAGAAGEPAPAGATRSPAQPGQPRPAGPVEAPVRPRNLGAGTITGTVKVNGADAGPVYVYVLNLAGPPASKQSLQIKQEAKQFVPEHAVVQAGTTVSFPNLDPIFHNVFSNSPRNSFDLGTYRAGEESRSVVLTRPGVVDIQCNMHEQMRAKVLVVPSSHYTRVRPDGSFSLAAVPGGRRRLIAWGPNVRPAQHTVNVSPAGAQANFALQAAETRVLPNKVGQAYGSYE